MSGDRGLSSWNESSTKRRDAMYSASRSLYADPAHPFADANITVESLKEIDPTVVERLLRRA